MLVYTRCAYRSSYSWAWAIQGIGKGHASHICRTHPRQAGYGCGSSCFQRLQPLTSLPPNDLGNPPIKWVRAFRPAYTSLHNWRVTSANRHIPPLECWLTFSRLLQPFHTTLQRNCSSKHLEAVQLYDSHQSASQPQWR